MVHEMCKKRISKFCQRQRGVALITALLVVAMVSIAAVAMASRQYMDIRRTANILHTDQAYLYANAAEVFAKQVLIFGDQDMNIDSRDEVWAQPLPPTPVDGGSIGGVLIDLNGAFPLNMLVKDDGSIDPVYVEILQRLLVILELKNPAIANNIADWIDVNQDSNGGFEDQDYLSLPQPYRTGNTVLVSLTELRLIGGFDEKGADLARLLGKPVPQDANQPATTPVLPPRGEPYINVLPRAAGQKIAINVNTAPKEVIMSLHKSITAEAADKVIAKRIPAKPGDQPSLFTSGEEFIGFLRAEIPIEVNPTKGQGVTGVVYQNEFNGEMKKIELSAKSEYFEMTATAQIGESQMLLKSLLQRKPAGQGGNVSVATIRRGLGEY